MNASTTFLAPGQRYTEAGSAAWRTEKQWTVVHVGREVSGLTRVTYQCPNGHQIVAPAEQFEAAIHAGQVVPVIGAGRLIRC